MIAFYVSDMNIMYELLKIDNGNDNELERGKVESDKVWVINMCVGLPKKKKRKKKDMCEF